MSAYIYFTAIVSLSILAMLYYKKYVSTPKLRALHNAHEFRHARNLNTELINLFSCYWDDLQHADCLFNGATYEATMANLQVLHNNVYTTDVFNQLIGKQKVKRRHVVALHDNIIEQIHMQQHIKANLNQFVARPKKRIAA
jgi:hypothetical protein